MDIEGEHFYISFVDCLLMSMLISTIYVIVILYIAEYGRRISALALQCTLDRIGASPRYDNRGIER